MSVTSPALVRTTVHVATFRVVTIATVLRNGTGEGVKKVRTRCANHISIVVYTYLI